MESAPPSVPKVLFDGIPNLVSHWSQPVRVIKFLLENGMSRGELGVGWWRNDNISQYCKFLSWDGVRGWVWGEGAAR